MLFLWSSIPTAYKLTGVHNFLQNAMANDLQPGDVIAIVDGFDLWSQLPATMLMERFMASGKRIVLVLTNSVFPMTLKVLSAIAFRNDHYRPMFSVVGRIKT